MPWSNTRTHDERAAHAHDMSSTSGEEPDPHAHEGGPPRESPWVITVPLILLAIPSVYAGWAYIEPMLFGNWFGDSIVVREPHAVVGELKAEWHGAVPFIAARLHVGDVLARDRGHRRGRLSVSRQSGAAGEDRRALPADLHAARQQVLLRSLQRVVLRGRLALARRLRVALVGDRTIIDGWVVNGSAKLVGVLSRAFRRIQSGYVYHYAFVMIIGVFGLLYWWGVR